MLRGRGPVAGEYLTGGGDGVDGVGFAVHAPHLPVWPQPLQHGESGGQQDAGEFGAVGVGALDPDRDQVLDLAQTAEQGSIVGPVGGELFGEFDRALGGDDGQRAGVGMGVDSGDGVVGRGLVCIVLFLSGPGPWVVGRPENRQDTDGTLTREMQLFRGECGGVGSAGVGDGGSEP